MAKPFDATTRRLLEVDPAGWLACLGLPITGPVRAVDSDLSTVTAEADTILRVGEPADYLAHIEIQTSHDRTLPARLLHYNVLIHYRHDLPVRSVAVLLRREADSPTFTGLHQVLLPDGTTYLEFRYSVLRIWTMDVEPFLQGGLGTLPLAPLADVEEARVPALIDRMKERLNRESSKQEASLYWAATNVLMGLRYSREFVARVLQGVQGMKESVTYQAILEEGEAKGKIRLSKQHLLFVGTLRLGEPDGRIKAMIEAMDDPDRVEGLFQRAMFVSSWDELLSLSQG